MHRSLAPILACAVAIAPARAGEEVSGAAVPELAARAWAATDAVLAHHVAPPARQTMLLAGLRAVEMAGGTPPTAATARRVSAVGSPDDFASILAETWAAASAGPKAGGRGKLEGALFEGLLAPVPGGATLLSAKERKVADQIDANLYVGIQVALGMDEGSKLPTFQTVLKGGPADRAGARSGDLIEEVDGVKAVGMSMEEVVDRLRGEEGTLVRVRVRRPKVADPLMMPMTRGTLPRQTVIGIHEKGEGGWDVMLVGPAPIGYLKIGEIAGSTPQELRDFARQLEAEGARALVLDLRGLHLARLHPTILLADALLDGGVIGRIREADADRVVRAEPDALFRGWPMAVLADDATAGEVGWLCAALGDNRRATIVGTPGPNDGGLVRSTVPLPGGDWSIRMANGRLERGDGRPVVAPPSKPPGDEPALVFGGPGGAEVIGPSRNHGNAPRMNFPLLMGPGRRMPPGAAKPGGDPLARAREILGDALKSPAP